MSQQGLYVPKKAYFRAKMAVLGAKNPHFYGKKQKYGYGTGLSGNSRSRSFPRMEASDSLPEFREWIFSFPSRSRISGMDFFIPFPFPNFGNGFFHSLPVPKFWEWIFFIPFPFPNFGNGFFPFPSRSRIDPFKVGNQKGKWEILRDACIPTFSASCTFHTR